MCSIQVNCPQCDRDNIRKFGYSEHGVPRYLCCSNECKTKSFMLEYRYKAYEPSIKKQIVEMAINDSSIRDISRVLSIDKKTIINTLKKRKWLG